MRKLLTKQTFDVSIGVVNLTAVSLIFMLLFSFVAVLGLNGEIRGLESDELLNQPIHGFLVTTFPLLMGLFVVPFIWERTFRKTAYQELFLTFPQGRWGRGSLVVSMGLLAVILFVHFKEVRGIYPVVHFIAVGVAEEFFYRGVLQYRLSQVMNRWGALFVSSVLFAFLLHSGQPMLDNLMYRLPLGLLFGAVTLLARSIWPAVALHAAYNLIVVE